MEGLKEELERRERELRAREGENREAVERAAKRDKDSKAALDRARSAPRIMSFVVVQSSRWGPMM